MLHNRLARHTAEKVYPVLPKAVQKPESDTSNWVWNDWLEFNSFHGVVDLTRPGYGRIWKTAWIVLILTFSALAIQSCVNLLDDFINSPTVQTYSIQPETALIIPDILICTHQRFDRYKLLRMDASPYLIDGIIGIMSQLEGQAAPAIVWDHQRLVEEYGRFRSQNGNITLDELMREAGVPCTSLVHSCNFQSGWGVEKAADCCKRAKVMLDPWYGQCFRFESNVTQTWPGQGSGATMVLRSMFSECGETKTNFVRGLLLDVAHPGETQSYTFYRIPAGVVATIHLHLQKHKRINLFGRRQTCRVPVQDPATPYGTYTLQSMKATTNGCFYSTWAEAQNVTCRCSAMPGILDIATCDPFNACIFENNSRVLDATKILQKQQCLPQCTQNAYDMSITYAILDTNAYNRMAKDSANSTVRMDNDTLALDVYHSKMQYAKLEEVQMNTPSSLISNVGGAIGLWLGASLMTFCQIVFYFAKWLSLKCFKCGSGQVNNEQYPKYAG